MDRREGERGGRERERGIEGQQFIIC